MIYSFVAAVVGGIEGQAGLRFDPTITLGTMIHLLILIVALVGAYYKILGKIDKVKADLLEKIAETNFKVSLMWDVFKRKFDTEEDKE